MTSQFTWVISTGGDTYLPASGFHYVGWQPTLDAIAVEWPNYKMEGNGWDVHLTVAGSGTVYSNTFLDSGNGTRAGTIYKAVQDFETFNPIVTGTDTSTDSNWGGLVKDASDSLI